MNVILKTGTFLDVVGLKSTRSSMLFRAVSESTRTPVVLKFALNNDQANLIGRETKALRRINHPGVIRLLSSSTDAPPHVVIEHIRGGVTLEEISRTLPRTSGEEMPIFNELLAAFVIYETAQALDAAHQAEIVHGDLKPSNVLFNSKGDLKLIDFGLSWHLADPPASLRGGYGSLQYSDPLQLLGSSVPDPVQDLYPLGVILYELAFRRRRFKSKDPVLQESERGKLLQMYKADRFPLTYPETPWWIWQIMHRTCRFDASKRWNSASAVLEFMDNEGIPRFSKEEFAIYIAGIKAKIRNKRLAKIPPPISWLTQIGVTVF